MTTLGRALLAESQPEEAAVVLGRAAELAPHDPEVGRLLTEAEAALVLVQSAEHPDEPEIGVLEPDGHVVRLTDMAEADPAAPAPGFTGYIRAIADQVPAAEPGGVPATDWSLPPDAFSPVPAAPAPDATQAVDALDELGPGREAPETEELAMTVVPADWSLDLEPAPEGPPPEIPESAPEPEMPESAPELDPRGPDEDPSERGTVE